MKTKNSIPSDKIALIAKWHNRCNSMKQFCKEENVSFHLLQYWHRKQKHLSSGSDKKFIKLPQPILSNSNSKTAEIIYKNGNRIILYGNQLTSELKQLTN